MDAGRIGGANTANLCAHDPEGEICTKPSQGKCMSLKEGGRWAREISSWPERGPNIQTWDVGTLFLVNHQQRYVRILKKQTRIVASHGHGFSFPPSLGRPWCRSFQRLNTIFRDISTSSHRIIFTTRHAICSNSNRYILYFVFPPDLLQSPPRTQYQQLLLQHPTPLDQRLNFSSTPTRTRPAKRASSSTGSSNRKTHKREVDWSLLLPRDTPSVCVCCVCVRLLAVANGARHHLQRHPAPPPAHPPQRPPTTRQSPPPQPPQSPPPPQPPTPLPLATHHHHPCYLSAPLITA